MSTAAHTGRRPAGRRRPSPRVIGIALAVVVVAAMALDTTYVEPGDTTATGREVFDPARFGEETFPKVVAEVERSATPMDELLPALEKDEEAASEQYGRRQGMSPYNFAVTGEGVAGKAEGGLMEVRVKGVPDRTRISLQVGPVINGTALRDVVGFIEFGQFTNQVEYADAATGLNTQVKSEVLAGIDPEALQGQRVSFSGAFTLVTPSVVTITPVRLETAP